MAEAKPGDGALPTRLGRYEIRGKIAEGGMATIYVGRLAGPGGFERLHALKVIKPGLSSDPDFVNMFLDEARIVAKLNHPNVVQIHELGEDGADGRKQLFIAMELLLGESLWDIWHVAQIRRRRELAAGKKFPVGTTALPHDVVAWIGARIAEGLHHAHELKDAKGTPQQLVHRDVNPSNVLVTYDGQVKIIDFGLAKALNRISETGFGVLKGKLSYMAPEQARGAKDLDRRADIFALGATLYELTTDERLFKRADRTETLAAVTKAEVRDPSNIVDGYSPALWKIVKRALEREREDRYPTALEMAQELDAFSRSRGRVVTASTVAALMKELFGDEWERTAQWMEAASSQDPPAEPLHVRRTSEDGAPADDEHVELVGQIAKSETRKETPAKKNNPAEPTLASPAKVSVPSPAAEQSAINAPTPAWHYVAVVVVCVIMIMMAVYASRL
jgi:serine/threonine-protein kinase